MSSQTTDPDCTPSETPVEVQADREIAKYYDRRGNPAALSSGWLHYRVDDTPEKNKFFVLAPKHLVLFDFASHADISAEGFMRGIFPEGDSNGPATSATSYVLSHISNVTHDKDSFVISFQYSEPGTDDVQSVTLRAQSLALSDQWYVALCHQVETSSSIEHVERTVSATTQVARSLAAVGGSIRNMMTAARSQGANRASGPEQSKDNAPASDAHDTPSQDTSGEKTTSVGTIEVSGPPEEPVAATDSEEKSEQTSDKRKGFSFNRQSFRNLSASLSVRTMNILPSRAAQKPKDTLKPLSLYEPQRPWQESFETMQSDSFGHKLLDDQGRSIVILHGWLSKRNKTGLRAGLVEKDRYFAMLPHGLAYFPDVQSANVVDGYLHGVVSGTKISGIFNKTGALLPLVSVCGIRVVRNEDDLQSASTIHDDLDDEDGDVRSESSSRPTSITEDISSPVTKDGESPKSATDDKDTNRSTSKDMETSMNDTMDSIAEDEEDEEGEKEEDDRFHYLDIDFGEYNLIANAHSREGCETWRNAIQSWSSWQKERVDQHMFTTMGDL